MLQRFLFITLTLCSLSATAQWQQTGSKVRYVNGLGIPTKDTAAGVAADSSQILIRPADSSLYIKYKRTWVKVGSGGGGTIGGSGTTNYVPKFTSASAIGNSIMYENAGVTYVKGYISVDPFSPVSPLSIIQVGSKNTLTSSDAKILVNNYYTNTTAANGHAFADNSDLQKNSGAWAYASYDGRVSITGTGVNADHYASFQSAPTYNFTGTMLYNYGTYTTHEISSGTITNNYANYVANPIKTGTGVITNNYGLYIENQNAGTNNYSIYSAGGTNYFAGNVGIGYTAPAAKLAVSGTTLINTNTDNGVDKLQVSGSILSSNAGLKIGSTTTSIESDGSSLYLKAAGNTYLNTSANAYVTNAGGINISTLATTNNLSVTTNATVGGTATIAGDVQITGLIGVGTTPQTYAIKLARSGNNIVEFGTQSATNYSRFVHSSSTPFGVIGNASGAGISGGSNGDFAIGTPSGSNNIIFHINAVERVRVKTDGEVLVFSSTDNGAYNLQCNGTGVWGAGAYVNGSDSALKYQIKDINNALHLVMQLKPKTYKYKPFYNNSNEIQTGFIAQDLEKVLKNEIYKDGVVISGGKYKGVAYDALIPLLVKTIQEQQSQIEDIKKQIEELKKLIK